MISRAPSTAEAIGAGGVRFVEQTRGPGIGASLAAACLGLSPHKSRIGAWLTVKGKAHDVAGPEAEWGTILEPVIRGTYSRRHGVEIIVPTRSYYHPDFPWLRCTPDGEMPAMNRGLQCKNVDSHLDWQWGPRSARSVPPHYRIQGVVEMAVMNWDRVDFAALIGGNCYIEVPVERDLELEAIVLGRLRQFWGWVERDEHPPIDAADDWRAYFADRLPREHVKAPADSETEALLDEWHEIRDSIEAGKTRVAEIKNLIMAAAVRDGVTKFETKHGDVPIVQPKGKQPYVKAPATWGDEKEE